MSGWSALTRWLPDAGGLLRDFTAQLATPGGQLLLLAIVTGAVLVGSAVWGLYSLLPPARLRLPALPRLRPLRRGRGNRSNAALTLAARGASPLEIAQRTGLSRDAVEMLLRTRAAQGSRRNVPDAARFAGLERLQSGAGLRTWAA